MILMEMKLNAILNGKPCDLNRKVVFSNSYFSFSKVIYDYVKYYIY